MRILNFLKGDFRFHLKYGFVFLYVLFSILYLLLISVLPESFKTIGTVLIIFTDPATLGMFFMGAIILLEKSQNVIASLAVSSLSIPSYIFSKIITLGSISVAVAIVLSYGSGIESGAHLIIGTLLASLFFSLLGFLVAAKVNSLNQFFIAIVPIQLICVVPPILYLLGIEKGVFSMFTTTISLSLMLGSNENSFLSILMMVISIILLFLLVQRAVRKMWDRIGGD